jgi:hypothetical protein
VLKWVPGAAGNSDFPLVRPGLLGSRQAGGGDGQRSWTQDVDYGRFRGQLTATGSGPAGANRVVKLEGRAQKADL